MPLMVNFKEREERVDLATLIILMKKEFLLLREKISEDRDKGVGRGAVKNDSLRGVHVM